MTNQPVWRVVVRRRVDDAREALEHAGIVLVSGHGTAASWSSTLLVRAPTEDAARAAIETALAPHAFIAQIERIPVYVHAPIEESARSAFEMAAGTDERFGGVIDDEQGLLEAVFVLESKSVPELFNEASGLYHRVLRDAGLPETPPPGPMWVGGLHALLDFESRARRLLRRAERLLTEKDEPALAVVVAQTACEVAIRDVLTGLVRARLDNAFAAWTESRFRTYTLTNDPQGQALWEMVTGSKINQQDAFWADYVNHVRRRNGIVHGGEDATSDDAATSLRVAGLVLGYVERASGLGRLG